MADIIILGIIAFSILVSLWRGFISEILSFAGWIIAFFVASYFYPYLAGYLNAWDTEGYLAQLQSSELIRNGLSAAILFIITLITCSIITSLIYRLISGFGLSGTDRILGGAFGALRGILIVAALIFFIDIFTAYDQSQWWKESQLIPHFDFIVQWFFEQLKSNSSFLK